MKGGTDVVDLKAGGLEQHSQCQTQDRKQWLCPQHCNVPSCDKGPGTHSCRFPTTCTRMTQGHILMEWKKLRNLRKLYGGIKNDPEGWKDHFSIGRIYILRKSDFFPCLQAEKKIQLPLKAFLSYAKRQKKRKGCSFQVKKKVKFKHSHKGKIIHFKVICSRTSLRSYPLSLMYLTLCKAISNPTLFQKNPCLSTLKPALP